MLANTKYNKINDIQKVYILFLKKVIPNFFNKIRLTDLGIEIKTTHTKLIPLMTFIKNHMLTHFKTLVDLVVYDRPKHALRFTLVYTLLSVNYNTRIKVYMQSNEIIQIHSLSKIFKNALWLEREAWDLFGIFFKKHPDLRKILTDYGFEGHPLRKDFPLTGFKEVTYNDEKKRILYTNSVTTQEYRSFLLKNPWI